MSENLPVAKTLWTNTAAGVGTTLAGAGSADSGAKLISLRTVCDLILTVTVGAPGGTNPTLVVQVDMQDACGNWITQVIKTSTINAAGTVVAYGGLHTSPGVVLTGLARVAWTIGGTGNPTFPSVGISLMGR